MMPIAETLRVYPGVGDSGLRALVDAFYRRVEADPLLRPIFPADLTQGRERQYLFLRQYFGGPAEYSERYGDPQLPRRHRPFPITREARDFWVTHMFAAIEEVGIPEPHASVMREYFQRFSLAMINQSDETPSPTFEPSRAHIPARLIDTINQ